MTNVLIWGIGGRMGRTLLECLNKNEYTTAVGGVDKFANQADFNIPIFQNISDINIKADVIIDFSRAEAIYDILPYAKENKIPVVLCTTGYSELDLDYINEMSKELPLFKSSNMSIGINLLIDLVKKATNLLGENFDIELIECHHNVKVDSPSGTALTIAEAINEEMNNTLEFKFGRHDNNERRKKNELGIHAVRGGTVVGRHEVLFLGNDETITIKHEANSKAVFAEGAVKASIYMSTIKTPGIYNMKNLIEETK
ncbi:MAG TPA: 4-hydroxy-tetrahydrodipicolinate reductase [Clostridia bacterium]|mgnify:CR=1 FL=1|nr:4-hydroxy-tetrahydrodipicolinate reductase [Clostridia bacterium]